MKEIGSAEASDPLRPGANLCIGFTHQTEDATPMIPVQAATPAAKA